MARNRSDELRGAPEGGERPAHLSEGREGATEGREEQSLAGRPGDPGRCVRVREPDRNGGARRVTEGHPSLQWRTAQGLGRLLARREAGRTEGELPGCAPNSDKVSAPGAGI